MSYTDKQGLIDRSPKRLGQKRLQPKPHLGCLIQLVSRRLKKRLPDAHILRSEIRTLSDGLAEIEKRFHQQRRQGKMIASIVEPMFGPEILRKSGHATEASLDQLRLPERTTSHNNDLCHLTGLGSEIVSVVPHHSLREGIDDAFQIKEIGDRIVILKSIHPPNRRLDEGLFSCHCLMPESFQIGE